MKVGWTFMKRIPKYGLTLLVLLCFVGLFFWKQDEPSDQGEIFIEQKKEKETQSLSEGQDIKEIIVVDVKGEVEKPGVYELKEGSRVKDAIETAGGMTNKAEPLSVNLAQKLLDEMVVYVTSSKNEDYSDREDDSFSDKLSINRASVEELKSLSGIGDSKANKIKSYREENGPFQRIEDLLNISGIGKKTLDGFREDIRVP